MNIQLLEREVLMWSGCAVGKEKEQQIFPSATSYGSKIPLFKARAIIPSMSPLALVELLLDSSRSKLYNKFSGGREDLHVFQDGVNVVDGLFGDGCLKICQSETKIPLSSKTIKMVNFVHARPITLYYDDLHEGRVDEKLGSSLNGDDCEKKSNAFIMVSRTIFTNEEMLEAKTRNLFQTTLGSSNEVILGVNILREVPGHPNKTDFTTLTQTNSSTIPKFLSHKVCLFSPFFATIFYLLLIVYSYVNQQVGMMSVGGFINGLRGMEEV